MHAACLPDGACLRGIRSAFALNIQTRKLTEDVSGKLAEGDYILLFEVGRCLRKVRGSLVVSEVSATNIKLRE